MIQKRMYGVVIRHAIMFSFLLISFFAPIMQQSLASMQNFVPAQGQVYVPPPAASLQAPTEAVMIPANPSALSLMPPGIIKIFKKASNTVRQMQTNIQLIDQKRDNIYVILFTTDKFLDSTYPNILVKLGKLEEIFMSQKIKKGSKLK